MAWGNGKEIYNVASIRAQAKKRAKVSRKRDKREQQALFDEAVRTAIEAGFPVTVVPYQGNREYRKRDDEVSALRAEVAALKAQRQERPKYRPGMGSEFYSTREWRSLRYDVISANNGKCKLCGRSSQDGIIIHIDHIKPRSKFPALELVFANMQILCEDCNIGKSNK